MCRTHYLLYFRHEGHAEKSEATHHHAAAAAGLSGGGGGGSALASCTEPGGATDADEEAQGGDGECSGAEEEDGGTLPLAAVDLRKVRRIEVRSDDGCSFALCGADAAMELKADSAMDARRWCAALKERVEMYNGR